MKPSSGSLRRVFCKPRNTGSVRSSVPKPRALMAAFGRAVALLRLRVAECGRVDAAFFKDAQRVAGAGRG